LHRGVNAGKRRRDGENFRLTRARRLIIWYTGKTKGITRGRTARGGEFMLIEIIKALLMGIVEGVTEWLPISSTGHMILVEQLIQFEASDAFISMFRVVIQLGANMAVVVLFWGKLRSEEHTSELQSRFDLVCRLLLEK